jgi:transcriptional regulator with XRE-family HTH domain
MTARSPTLTPEAFATFGQLLRFLRQRAQLTQRDLAIAVGYSEAQVSRLEQGHRLPNRELVQARFLAALYIEHESAWAKRLLALADAAHARADRPSWADVPHAAPASPAADLPLLQTKLYLPRPRAALFPRPRLFARLDAGVAEPLMIIAAQAGFGKTTLLASWLATRTEGRGLRAESAPLSPRPSVLSTRVAWLSLDADDNDPELPLARLRTGGQLIELRAADLRFTADEAAAFLTQTLGLPLAPADVRALEERTEGWIAGSITGRTSALYQSGKTFSISVFCVK